MHVDPRDKRWSKLVHWLANEHTILAETLGRKPTTAEHRAHAHAFIDMVFDDEEKLWADLAARKAQAPPARHPPDPEMAEGGRPGRRNRGGSVATRLSTAHATLRPVAQPCDV
jgi:hypothetical protein